MTESRIRIQVVHAWPDRYWSTTLELPENATAGDVLDACRAGLADSGIDPGDMSLAVFGRSIQAGNRLRDGDRLELLRPLLLSPQQARASRAAAARRAARK